MMKKQKRALDIIPVEMSGWGPLLLGPTAVENGAVGRATFGVPGPVPDHVTAAVIVALRTTHPRRCPITINKLFLPFF